jgi:hypothetical protein
VYYVPVSSKFMENFVLLNAALVAVCVARGKKTISIFEMQDNARTYIIVLIALIWKIDPNLFLTIAFVCIPFRR